MDINIAQLITDIKDVVATILRKDISEVRGFQERQVEALAKQAQLIASGVANGDIDDELRKFFIDNLEQMALNFVKTLKGLMEITIEKVWNAVVNTLLETISNIIGVAVGLL